MFEEDQEHGKDEEEPVMPIIVLAPDASQAQAAPIAPVVLERDSFHDMNENVQDEQIQPQVMPNSPRIPNMLPREDIDY